MNLEEFLKNQKYHVEDIKYPINKITYKDDCAFIHLKDERIKISLDDYVEYSLSSLKGLDDNLYEILKKKEIYLKAYEGCIRKLSVKDNTVKQIKTYLNRYDLEEKDADDIINRLKDKGYLNDEKYCINRIASLEPTLLSSKQIRMKLMKEGVSSYYIDKHLKVKDEKDKTSDLVKKYNKSINNKSLKSKKMAIRSKLASLGFDQDDIAYAMNHEDVSQTRENELLNKEYLKAKNRFMKKYEGFELKNRITQSLLMKGFNYEDIKQIINDDELL